jgi:hypothetical protein
MSDDVFPDRSMEHRDKIAWMIETNGWAVNPVDPQPDLRPPRGGYVYTIGLRDLFGFPEVVVCGLTPSAANGLLGELVGLLRDGVALPIGEQFRGLLDGEQRSALVPVDVRAHSDRFDALHDWYGNDWYGNHDVQIVQLVWPDRNGFLPDEVGFDQRLRFAQPLLT